MTGPTDSPARRDTASTTGRPAVPTILVIDDARRASRALHMNLAARGYHVVTAGTTAAGLDAAATHSPAVVILDDGPDDLSAVEALKALRRGVTAPVLVLSARGGTDDKVEALDAGADDYLTKPFNMDELLARLRAVARRTGAPGGVVESIVQTAGFTVDLWAKKVTRNGSAVHLTPREWNILEILVRNRGRLVDRDSLLNQVRGPFHLGTTNYLRVYLAQLRRKLEEDPAHPTHLLTEAGMGYRFEQ